MPNTRKEIRALMDEMRKIAAKGERVIDCAIVCKALIRISDAHQHDIDALVEEVRKSARILL